jgi:hypothetical protein
MSARHSVIILTHFPFQYSIWGGEKGSATEPSSFLIDGDFVNRWRLIPEIVEAFRTHSSIKKTFTNKTNWAKGDIDVDFDFTSATGDFICYLGGHIHCFALFDIAGTNTLLPSQKMILCTNQSPSEVGKRFNRVERKDNSITSNSFNIYAIDTYEKKVYITFFGAYLPSDDASFPEVLEFSYL